jgi:SAM-dependent methyltransferase
VINDQYNGFAKSRLSGKFGEMGSWRLVLPYLADRRTLDIGCANGLYFRYLRKDSVGIEQIPELVSNGRANGLSIIEGDISKTHTIGDKEFDAVLYSHVMEHVDCPIGTLKEINRVLRQNGRIVLGLPIERSIYRDMLHMDYFNGTHIYAFTIRNATKLLNETGFKVVRVIYHLPKCRSRLGGAFLRLFNATPLPFREYFSLSYWIVADKT